MTVSGVAAWAEGGCRAMTGRSRRRGIQNADPRNVTRGLGQERTVGLILSSERFGPAKTQRLKSIASITVSVWSNVTRGAASNPWLLARM